MIAFAVRTGTRRNLAALSAAGWGLMVSAGGVWRTEGFKTWVADNGAWRDFQEGKPFDVARFERFLIWVEHQIRADNPPLWLVLPDIVLGGGRSLDISIHWLSILRSRPALHGCRYMLSVQNGMENEPMLGVVRNVVGPEVGIFVGGDTAWKLATLHFWAAFAHERGALCHVARVNSARRARICDRAGVDSFDGSGPSRYEKCLHQVDAAFVQRDLVGLCERLGREAPQP